MKQGESTPSGVTGLTHFDTDGNAHMVPVGDKDSTNRRAVARGSIRMNPTAMEALLSGQCTKGDVLGVARIAGIMAAKKNGELIPLCHSIPLTGCEISFETEPDCGLVTAFCTVSCVWKTGVEMEALTGVSVALLTIYDMLKAVDRGMEITGICLQEKDGGRSGHYIRKD